jgi:hypothetical protein
LFDAKWRKHTSLTSRLQKHHTDSHKPGANIKAHLALHNEILSIAEVIVHILVTNRAQVSDLAQFARDANAAHCEDTRQHGAPVEVAFVVNRCEWGICIARARSDQNPKKGTSVSGMQ